MQEMETLKIKVGPHEFEATGSPESVSEKFAAFKELVAMMSNSVLTHAKESIKKTMDGMAEIIASDDQLSKIMRLNGREVSLTARPQTLVDAILLVVFGQKALRQNDAVTGTEIISGLNTTGGYSFTRIDKILEKLAHDGDLLIFGEHRGKKYRLTNTGLAKARSIAAELISSTA
jgi:predicted transcriptional regulator